MGFLGGVAYGEGLYAAGRRQSAAPAAKTLPLPRTVLLDVPAENQYPLLPNGCEVTSLSMLLTAVGHPLSPLRLAAMLPRDPTPRVLGPGGVIRFWGNPEVGFVGHMRDLYDGYGVYHKPIVRLLDRILPGRAVDLTGRPFPVIQRYLAAGRPVVMWTTIDFRPTTAWIRWNSPEGPVRATLQEHAVLLVGYDSTQVFVDNPIGGLKAEPTSLGPFLAAWRQLGRQAVTVSLPNQRSRAER